MLLALNYFLGTFLSCVALHKKVLSGAALRSPRVGRWDAGLMGCWLQLQLPSVRMMSFGFCVVNSVFPPPSCHSNENEYCLIFLLTSLATFTTSLPCPSAGSMSLSRHLCLYSFPGLLVLICYPDIGISSFSDHQHLNPVSPVSHS